MWNAASGKELLVLRQHSNTVTSVAFSPNGKMLASGGYDGKVILWDVATGIIRHQLPGHRGRVEEVYFSPDGTLLVSAGMTVNEKNQRQEETFVWKVSSGLP